jgi:hypothetical protein
VDCGIGIKYWWPQCHSVQLHWVLWGMLNLMIFQLEGSRNSEVHWRPHGYKVLSENIKGRDHFEDLGKSSQVKALHRWIYSGPSIWIST